jgi:hypothetical protein
MHRGARRWAARGPLAIICGLGTCAPLSPAARQAGPYGSLTRSAAGPLHRNSVSSHCEGICRHSFAYAMHPALMPPPRRAGPVSHGRCARLDGAPAVVARSRQRTWTPPRGTPALPYNDRLEHGRDNPLNDSAFLPTDWSILRGGGYRLRLQRTRSDRMRHAGNVLRPAALGDSPREVLPWRLGATAPRLAPAAR